jgi:hypothetical protein
MSSVVKLSFIWLLLTITAGPFVLVGCKSRGQVLLSTAKENVPLNDCKEANHIAKEIEEVVLSSLVTGSSSSGQVPDIANAFSDLHNHPNNTPPSSGDLYGLLRKNVRNSSYTTRFILTYGGNLFVFAVTDSAAVRRFLVSYPPQQTPGYSPLFPDALLDEYREIQQRYGVPEELAMAFLLEKYNVGVALLKQSTNGSFKKIKTILSVQKGEKKFAAGECPEEGDKSFPE